MNTVNFWPVLVAAVVSFGIGALWYSPFLFGKEWMSLLKLGDKDMEAMQSGVWKSYIVQFIATLITFIILAFAISGMGVDAAIDGAFIGFLAWLGFIVPTAASSMLWKKESLKLVLIDTIGVLVNLVIGGAIISAWR